MKIVLAPDKFKGSLTGPEFCDVVEESLLQFFSSVDILKLPLADGGDGTIEVVNYYLQGELISIEVNNPLFNPVNASYLYASNSQTAFIEMAEASGLKLLEPKAYNCKKATTFGTGEMIAHAINNGATQIILGIGGSATNDCGIGMAAALGYEFRDKNDRIVIPIGENLSKIRSIDASNIHHKLKEVTFKIACDVINPLYGPNGAAYVYGKQKGASNEDVRMLDKGLRDFANVLNNTFNLEVQTIVGGGAAGGMGVASNVFLNGSLQSGIDLIKELANFDKLTKNTDWIITGEGRLDNQTLSGKTINGVISSAKKNGSKVAAFCGSIDLNEKEISALGISYSDTVISQSKSLDDALINAQQYLRKIAKNFANHELL